MSPLSRSYRSLRLTARLAAVTTVAGLAVGGAGLLGAPSASAGPECYYGPQETGVSGCPHKAATQIVVTPSADPAYAGTSVGLTAKVTSSGTAVSGTVAFFANGTRMGSATLANGVGTVSIANLPIGQNSIAAVYSGNAADLGSTASVNEEIVPFPLRVSRVSVNFGKTPVGTTASPQIIVVSNIGSTPWSWAGVTSTDPAFSLSPSFLPPATVPCTDTVRFPFLQPGVSCSIAAVYRPSVAGTDKGTIVIDGLAGNGVSVPVVITTTGTATAPPR